MKRLLPFGVLVCLLAFAGSASALSYRPAGVTTADSPVAAATALVEQRPALVDGADAEELVVADQTRGVAGTTIVRFDQELNGVPVLGGEVIVTVDARRRVVTADGEVLDGASPAMGPSISAAQARQLALAALGKTFGDGLLAGDPSLVIYDARIIGGPGPQEPVLVWDLEVVGGPEQHWRVFVDATTGYLVQTMDLVRTALNRKVCDAGNANAQVPCTSGFARTEGAAATGIADVDAAYEYAGVTYDFYRALGRDSIDDAGLPIVSTVRFCDGGCPFANAYWDGTQMVYGTGYASADDVVAHELTHGVTEYTSDLVYWYQSGAINEALSDIMGEFVDLANPGSGATADTAANRWLMGEDLPIGAIRDMENPPAYGDPDRIGSVLYHTAASDNGGVHINSGVANKTAFLIADGGTFNGQTVTGLGLTKSAWLWYQAGLTLRFAADFGDLADALDGSCSTLATLGTAGFSAGDCTQVARATLATELRTEPSSVTVPAFCTSGAPTDVFNDGFDAGPGVKWTIGHNASVGTANRWYGSSQTSPDGAAMHWPSALSTNVRGEASEIRSDSTMAMTAGVVVPSGESHFSFNHVYEFEYNDGFGQNFDGGVVEYSTNGGGTWTDIGALTAVNGYTGTINASLNSDNPLEGRSGYVRASNGPVVTRISLSTLAGQTIRFRFRVATDTGTSTTGWYIDSARIYGCNAGASAISAVSPASGSSAGGTTITLTGANLADVTAVTVGGAPATSVTVVNSTTVTAVTPARANSLVDVAATTPTATVTANAAFTYAVSTPTITGVSPSSGLIAGGATITITGANLTGATNVMLGGTPATNVTVVSATQLTAVTPARGAGVVDLSVVTPGGTATSAGAFTFIAPPAITGVSPPSGPTAGGTTITISGAHLTGATGVTVGGSAATSVTVVNSTTVTAVTPARATGVVDVSVTTPGGTTTSASAFAYVAAPIITGVGPTTGSPAGGTTITISGANLSGATGVTVGGSAATSVTVVSATQVTAVTPAGAAGTVDVSVTTPGGTVTSSGAFTYVASPTITGVSPASGPTGGGTTITISGADLTGATGVTVGGSPATSVTVVNSTQVTAVTPAHAAGSVGVSVVVPSGTVTSSGAFTYLAAPTITGVGPTSGSTAGGTTITISGVDLSGATSVTVGGVAATSITVVSATQLTAITPARAAGTVNLSVTTPGGTTTLGDAFTYTTPASAAPASAAPVASPVAPSSSTPTPSSMATTPPSSGLWTTNAVSDVVRALFAYKSSTTYTIKAVKGTTTRRGTCKRAGTTISCSVRAPNGRWRITVTPKVNGKTGKAISRTVTT